MATKKRKKTANQQVLDATLRRQVDVRRYSAGEVRDINALLEAADRDLTDRLRTRLSDMGGQADFKSSRWKSLLLDIAALRAQLLGSVQNRLTTNLQELATQEASAEAAIIKRAVPVIADFASVAPETLRALTRDPFYGHTLQEWFQGVAQQDLGRIRQALQIGMAQGESVPNIVRRVAGTPTNAFGDGALAMTRRNVETVVRTAVTSVSNSARQEALSGNEDIIAGYVFVATLDSRTSAICQANDGKMIPVGDKPLPEGAEEADGVPPLHPNCRSTTVAVLDGRGVEESAVRPYKGLEGDVGTVPARTTYQEFLAGQPAEFQDEVLGVEKAKLFREGGLKVDQFVDRRGNELTLSQLQERHPAAFDKAGVQA